MKIEKIKEKEDIVRLLLEELRKSLNNKRVEFDKNPNDWNYITSLGHSEIKLKELLKLIEVD